ncbi:hypothetical protein B5X24_HaOG212143 [Helicoverpa armigera]|nr:hypothetical protein B5X24_HaOG212143 [Helicoverpa armigera]
MTTSPAFTLLRNRNDIELPILIKCKYASQAGVIFNRSLNMHRSLLLNISGAADTCAGASIYQSEHEPHLQIKHTVLELFLIFDCVMRKLDLKTFVV